MASITYPATRKNIPPAGLAAQAEVREKAAVRYEYNQHLPPALRSAPDAGAADRLPELLEEARRRALTADEAAALAEALRRHEPWLEWTGKRERPWFKVEPVALHMHERVSTAGDPAGAPAARRAARRLARALGRVGLVEEAG